jgi:hypothetical protein
VPVNKYEPRMFVGKEVPEGATHYIIEGSNVVFFMMHPWLGMCVHVDYEGVSSWINYNNTKYPAHTFYELIKLPEQENIMKKEFTKADLKSGMKVVLRNGQCLTVLKDTFEEGTVIVANSGAWSKLEDYDENFCFEDRGLCELDIDIVYTVYPYEMLYNTSIKDAKEILWKREEKTPEQLAYEALQAQIAEEEARHADSIKALREQAEKFKPKIGG